ncbi:MAG TPA: hypothetical protein VGB08_01480 [Allosphingosinicella sp.]
MTRYPNIMLKQLITWLSSTPPAPDGADEKDCETASQQSDELADILFEETGKAYDREIEENEGLWRSLPVFAASFGFAVALIGYALTNAPTPSWHVPAAGTYILILSAVTAFVWSFRWFWRVVRPRRFRYLPPEPEILAFAESLRAFHRESGASDADANREAASELKSYLTEQWAEAAAHNQALNQGRAYSRGRTVFYLMACFVVTLAANALIIGVKKVATAATEQAEENADTPFDKPPTRSQPAGAARTAASAATSAAAAAIHRRGGEFPLPPPSPGATPLSNNKEPAAPSRPPPQQGSQPTAQRPTPPAPRLVEKSSQVPSRRQRD